ncbi:hypothetical protein O6H91_Y572100 [Diphasiastrum complanatum]|nr:hypothetical protein O6H91_Y572100 [Diphasiastrum complanatum]
MPRNSHVKSEEMSKELSYDLASDSEFVCGPRISFSCDFVLYDKEADFMEVNRNEYKADSPDFEFAAPNCIELCPARVCMLPADELFHDGKLLPLQPISYGAQHDDRNIENLHQIVPTSNTDTFNEAFQSCELLQSLSITQTSSPVDDSSPPVSPKVPTCGARLGELFRSKKGQFHREQCSSLGGRQKTPWRLRRLFNQSRSVGSAEEMDKFCLRSDSLPVYSTPMHDGSANSFFSRLTSTDTSSLAVFDGKEDDRYGDDQQPQPIIPPGQLFKFSQDHAEITSASRAGGNRCARKLDQELCREFRPKLWITCSQEA